MIDKATFLDWKQHPVTEALFSELKEAKEAALGALLSGDITDQVGEVGRMVGIAKLVEQILAFTPIEDEE